MAFNVFEGWTIFPLASVGVDAPSDFYGVSFGSVGGVGVRMDDVVRS